ncbi:MAG: IPT/TIG domain-containing protein [Bryobacterales bacterium]|nr:IPT/TIG domain-containing protein [Bryobacterales bacterium]
MSAGGLFFTERGAFAQALTLTPAQTEGPYYPNVMPVDRDNDLLLLNDNITPAVGTVSWISGSILSRTGSPIRNAVIEIWGADNLGSYIHTSGALNGQRDSNYQGYGRFETASNGAYLFRAIKPGLYPGRVRHVHAKITIPGGQSLTTQLYIEGETGTDSVLSGIRDAAQRASVIRPWTAIAGSPIGALSVNWDVVMDYTAPEIAAATRPALISMAGVTHGATLRAGAASGSWVALHGSALAATARTWRADEIVDGNLPTSLDGVSVQINNQPAYVQYISPTQINALAPEAVTGGTVQVTVTNANGTSAPVTVEFVRTSPGFFQYAEEHIAAVRPDGSYVAPEGLLEGVAAAPARPGETIVLYGTGFGPTSPAASPGKVVTSALRTASDVRVRIHNQDAAVSYSGLVSAGLYQINVAVPADLADGDYPVVAEVGGVRTGKFVKLRVQRQTTAQLPAITRPLPGLNILRHTAA